MKRFFAMCLLLAMCVSHGCTSECGNIARNRSAVATSNYDYNLTAQLVTDGIVTESEPCWLQVATAQGELPKREKEWTIDKGPFSTAELEGESNFLDYEWKGGVSFSSGLVRITGGVALEDGASGADWSVNCLASVGGAQLEKVGGVAGRGLPGIPYGIVKVDDPNKMEGSIDLQQRMFIFEIPLTCGSFDHFKIEFNLPGAHLWNISAVDFAGESGKFGKNTDSGHYYQSKEARGINILPSEHFTSAWMSADAEPQSITIDLGSVSKIKEVKIHWIHKSESGSVEISKDGESWKKVADLPSTEELTYSVSAKGAARYVRVNMEGADESGHFCISEIEVIGTEKSAECSEWALQRASAVEHGGESISTPDFKSCGWMPAVVPGTVLYSYITAGAVPDPALADYNQQISESYFNSDFWYRGVIKKEGEGAKTFLQFDGINWKAEVFMNGKYLGRIDGAFKRASFDVTDIAADENVVAVHLIKNANYGSVKEKNVESPDFNGGVLGADNPTFHATVGWDWIPTVRGREIGIWNDVRLVSSPEWTFANALVESKVSAEGKASVKAVVELTNHSGVALCGTVKGAIGDVQFEQRVSVEAGATVDVSFDPSEFAQLKDCDLALWWPVDMGEQVLHDAWYVFVPDGAVEAGHDFQYKAGIREFTYSDVKSNLKMFVNGHRFFPKGGNWGFSEFNLRYADKYDTAVKYHADMHLNMIRNWVGQTGDEEFYDACDRYGVVVWQDFWLANPADGPDPDDDAMFLDNAQDYVRRIRSHASIGLYCGRNEGYPPAFINAGLEKIVASLHPDIVYIPNSADDGVSGHGPYRAVNPDWYFVNPTTKFHSERGMPAVMNYSSLMKLFDGKPSWPNDNVWGQHDFTKNGAQGDVAFLEMTEKGFGAGAMASVEEFAHFAQWVNYDGYRAMYEANNAGGHGLLIWMSHSCWPSLAWQTYDYWFDKNGAYYGTKKACEPLHIQFNPARMTIQVANYTQEKGEGLTAAVSLKNVAGEEVFSKSAIVSTGCYSVVDALSCSDVPDGPCIMTLTLTSADGKVVSENIYIRNFEKGVNTGDYTAFSREKLDEVFEYCLK